VKGQAIVGFRQGETFLHRQVLARFNAANRSMMAKDRALAFRRNIATYSLVNVPERAAQHVLGVILTSKMLAAEAWH
jgi:hypothetical protein